MSQIKVGDLVIHRLSKIQLFEFSLSSEKYSSSPGIVLEINCNKLLILWDSYTEWVDLAYLLKISKAN